MVYNYDIKHPYYFSLLYQNKCTIRVKQKSQKEGSF